MIEYNILILNNKEQLIYKGPLNNFNSSTYKEEIISTIEITKIKQEQNTTIITTPIVIINKKLCQKKILTCKNIIGKKSLIQIISKKHHTNTYPMSTKVMSTNENIMQEICKLLSNKNHVLTKKK